MKDTDIETQFPWTLAFLTCSVCFFGFVRFMKFLNITLPSIFFWVAIISLLLAAFSSLVSLILKKKNTEHPRYFKKIHIEGR